MQVSVKELIIGTAGAVMLGALGTYTLQKLTEKKENKAEE